MKRLQVSGSGGLKLETLLIKVYFGFADNLVVFLRITQIHTHTHRLIHTHIQSYTHPSHSLTYKSKHTTIHTNSQTHRHI